MKSLLADIGQNVLGWDNTYFITIRHMLTQPGTLLRDYFDGTRKRYMNPFSFLIIGMTLAIFVFSAFEDDFTKANTSFMQHHLEWMGTHFGGPYASEEFQKEQLANSQQQVRFQLNYFNIMTLLLLPLYTLIAYILYGKPYNFTEHLITNNYIQGVSFISISLFFLLSLWTHPLVYMCNMFSTILLYTYVYGKLYRLSFWQSVLKIILFLAVIGILIVVIGVLTFIVALIAERFFS